MRRAIVVIAALLIIALVLGGVAAQSPFEIRVFIDNENLTVYIPSSGLVSLRGFGFQVQVNGQTRLYVLEEYAAFGIPFDQLPTPLCFRLHNSGGRIPLAQACNGIVTLTQELAPADVFWFDAVAGVSRALLLMQGDVPFAICASGANECLATFTPPTNTTTPQFTATSNVTPTQYPRFEGANTDWTPQITTINGIDVALVPPGCFTMGSADFEDAPPHEQCIEEPFYIGVAEVTNAQYAQCIDSGGCTPLPEDTYISDWEYSNHPVIFVDWFQSHSFAEWWGGRLPTESEWEYAARGTSSWIYPWGNDWYAYVNDRRSDWNEFTSAVGAFPNGSSWIGALDMAGNVWEWVSSLYVVYPYNPDDGRELDTENNIDHKRVARGGSWFDSGTALFRSSLRLENEPDFRSDEIGFRVARDYP